MAIVFKPETHSYTSIDPAENINWISVTSIISKFKKPFDAEVIAAKSAKNKKSKWYGLDVNVIKEAWKNESQKAVNLGSWYHNQREKDLLLYAADRRLRQIRSTGHNLLLQRHVRRHRVQSRQE